ncbi:hypothetical protein [Streptosporangium canum]|uniref:hypothetical protein n=1 Tax=Streptosporangium canum TaxID=324952 RepID=UPI0037B93038
MESAHRTPDLRKTLFPEIQPAGEAMGAPVVTTQKTTDMQVGGPSSNVDLKVLKKALTCISVENFADATGPP